MHIKYPKIYELGKSEVLGILDTPCYIYEKLDGANASIWMEDGEIKLGSRNRELKEDESFRGFREYVDTHEGIKKLFKFYPKHRLFGEWLCSHTVKYDQSRYNKFYLFDILVEDQGWGDFDEIAIAAEHFNFETPTLIGRYENGVDKAILKAKLNEYPSPIEGFVIKSTSYRDSYGHRVHAKFVRDDFKETNSKTFKGRPKAEEHYWENWVAESFCTQARLNKIICKIVDLETKNTEELILGKEHTPRILSMCYNDLITEEAWTIAKKVDKISYKVLRSICDGKFKELFFNKLGE